MQRTSVVYQNEMERLERDKSLIRITYGAVDLDAGPDAQIRDNGHLYYSDTGSLAFEDGIPRQTYITLEKNRFKADGKQLIPSRDAPMKQGYVSKVLSGEDGIYTACPVIQVDFSKKHASAALTFVFDASTGDYPTEIDVVVFLGGKIVETVTAYPDNSYYILFRELEYDGLRLVWKRGKPYHRARLQNIKFGAGMIFENDTISSAAHVMDTDPLQRSLEESTLDFTIINLDGMYDPDNPRGLWEYVENEQPITVEYGQRIKKGVTWADVYANSWANMELTTWAALYEGGFVEWVPGGRYVLNGQPEVKGLLASFHGRSRLMSLTDPYHKGQYRPGGITLYDLAVEVLEDAGVPEVYEGEKPYVLNDGLKKIKTTAPLPKTSHRECLQLIAHAACMIAYTDREGFIRIEPISQEQHNAQLDFGTLKDWPDVTKVPPLYGVNVKAYTYRPAAEVRELHKATYDPGSYLVEFDFATNVTVTGAASYTVMTGTVQFTVKARGEVVVSGKPLEGSTSTVYSLTGQSGETEEIDNPLITDRATAQRVADYAREYLRLRCTYEFDYRGNPEIDSTDLLYGQSRFSERFPMRVLRHEIRKGEGIDGHMIAKGMVK